MVRHKYGAVPTEVDGIRFDSKAEAKRYGFLSMLQSAGEISDLQLQPAFPIVVNGVKVATYKADFRYRDGDGKDVIEDVKGHPTPTYRLKKKLVEAIYPHISITEVRA